MIFPRSLSVLIPSCLSTLINSLNTCCGGREEGDHLFCTLVPLYKIRWPLPISSCISYPRIQLPTSRRHLQWTWLCRAVVDGTTLRCRGKLVWNRATVSDLQRTMGFSLWGSCCSTHLVKNYNERKEADVFNESKQNNGPLRRAFFQQFLPSPTDIVP